MLGTECSWLCEDTRGKNTEIKDNKKYYKKLWNEKYAYTLRSKAHQIIQTSYSIQTIK